MKKNTFVYFIALCLTSLVSFAQLSDLAKIEYVGLPESSDGGASFNRYKAVVNYPIKLKQEGAFFIVGLDYRYITFDADEDLIPFDSEDLSEIKQLSLSFSYTYKINEDWRFGAQIQPGYSTNLDVGDIGFDDAVLSGNVVFINDKKEDETVKKPNRLILGVSVSGNGGFPILPFISYFRKFHPKWSYNLGVPKTQLQYYISERSRLKLVARIDGFSTNLQNDLPISPGVEPAERLRQRLILGGLRYEFKLTDHLEVYFNGSYVIDNSIELRDDSRDTLFDFEEDNSFYIKTGIRFKI